MNHFVFGPAATVAACGVRLSATETVGKAPVFVDCPRCRPYLPRERVVSAQDLQNRLNQMRYADDHGDSNPGLAECRAYERDDLRAKLARVMAGETIREVYRDGRWQDAD